MRGQAENPQFGCKVDNKYEAIADTDDPFEVLDRLDISAAPKKESTSDKGKPKAAGDKGATGAAKKDKVTDNKKDTKPQSAAGKQDPTAKKPADRSIAQEKPKTAGDKPARADNAQQGPRRPRGGAAPRGGALPQQAGVIGLTPANVPAPAVEPGQPQAAGEDDHAAANADGFQQPRFASGGYRGRRGGPRGGPPSAGAAPGGFRRPRGGFGGPRYPPAAQNEQEAGAAQPAAAGGALNESGEAEERLERNFERRGGQRPFGGFRGGPGYARRGGFRRGPAPPGAGFFEDGTGRKREFERHSGSDVTGVRPVDKREGSGAHNWGTARDDLAGQTEALNETEQGEDGEKRAAETAAAGPKEAKAGEAWTDLVNADESAKAAEGETGASEQDKMYVLDDWKAKEEKERFRVPEFNVRKANEGSDSAKWTGFVLKKREEEEEEVVEEEDIVDDDDLQGGDGDDAKRKGKQRLNIPVKFANAGYRGRGGRGGRGAPYERREGGEQRGSFDRPRGNIRGGFRGAPGSGQAGAPQLTMDEFPSLNKQAA